MHYLLIPYSLLTGLYLLSFSKRREAYARGGMALAAAATLSLFFIAGVTRPIHGDSSRYGYRFQFLRTLSLPEALAEQSTDPLFTVLNWVVGQFNAEPAALFAVILLIYIFLFIVAIRRLVGPLPVVMVLMAYSMYPYFIAYGVNGLRQGLSLVFMLLGLVALAQGRPRQGWAWLLVAPFWHSGTWLALAVIALHQLMQSWVRNPNHRLFIVAAAFIGVTILSITGLNQGLMSVLPDYFEVNPSHSLYFDTAEAQDIDYRTGFRWDFYLFSLVPVMTGWLLRQSIKPDQRIELLWWLALYLSLNILYHLFSYAPFSDRFASFSWFLMPLVVFLQAWSTGRQRIMLYFVLATTIVNLLMLQFYTGNFLDKPGWLL